MIRRVACVVVLVLSLSTAPALAQTSPFEPIPTPVIPTATPTLVTPPPLPDAPSDDAPAGRSNDRQVLLVIGISLAVVFAAIGVYITRDARRNLTEADRRSLEHSKPGAPRDDVSPAQRKEATRQKQQARKKAKAQRQARKAQRKR